MLCIDNPESARPRWDRVVHNDGYGLSGCVVCDIKRHLLALRDPLIGEPGSYFIGRQSVGAAASTTRTGVKGLLKDAGLPHSGMIRFVPLENAANEGLLRGPGGRGFVDRFGNVWIRGRGQTVGELHWDVQLSEVGKKQLGWLSKSGNHLNVTRDGRIAH